ncbi:hypothetical protein RJ45_25250 [Photobacterium gaetbulicola]|uniref:General secretion pathway protein GspI n=1 Tax=Photobacterium gaetbulicola TaxID=1295392 RepID=A0A0B9GNP8_9GAMM|nr:hypothetical protein RJ45_25250 [Photobacterium gaetbulicola]
MIEVLVSLAIVAVGVLAMIKMQSYYDREGETAVKGLIAIQIAENQLELVNALSFADISVSGGSGTISRAGATFDWQQVVRTKILSAAGDAKQIEVTVSWQDRWEQQQNVSLVTLRTQY